MVAQQPAQTLRIVRTGHCRRHIPCRKRHGSRTAPPDAIRLHALHRTAGRALHRNGRHTHRRQRRRHARSQRIGAVQRFCPRLVHGHDRRRDAPHTTPDRDQQAPHVQDAHHTILHRARGQLWRYPHTAGRSPALPALPARRRLLLVHEPRAAMALCGRTAHAHLLLHRPLLLRQGARRGTPQAGQG